MAKFLSCDVIVLTVSKYNVVDPDTGVVNSGCTVKYIVGDSLAPCSEPENNLKGYKTSKASLVDAAFDIFKEVPGIYYADLDLNISNDGTTKVAAKNFNFVRSLFPEKAGKN